MSGIIAAHYVDSGGSQYSSAVLADSPLAYWRLGEPNGSTTMVDSSGNGHNGTYQASPTLGVTGLVTGGTDTAMSIPSGIKGAACGPSAAWMSATALTVEALIKPSALSGTQSIVSRFDSGNLSTGSFELRLEGALLYFYIFSGGSYTAAASSTSLVVNTRYHVAGTWDGTNIKVYINGTVDGPGASRTGINNSLGITIGYNQGSIQQPYAGVIDEVAYYGTALTATRLTAHKTAAGL